MNSLKLDEARAQNVKCSRNELTVDLIDGRKISVPLTWFPRLQHSTPKQRNKWRLIGRGEGIHWPELDEDISVEALLEGQASGETSASIEKWLQRRTNRKTLRKQRR